MNNKKYKKLLWGTGFVSIVLILTLFIMSQTYIQNLVYHERLNQMEEVTHQMFHSLEDVIDTHWDEVNVQCNYLYYTPLKTDTEFYRYLQKLSELSNYHEKQVELIAVDSAGHYYTEHGGMGLLREMNYLEDSPQRVSYVSNSLTVDDSRMVFLEQLSTPITLQSGEKEITLRYFGISQSMTQLNDYFRCDAYENNNSVYVLDNNGFKLFNANDTELLKGHNVYTVLSRMSYLHGSFFAEAKERLDRIIRQQAGQRRQTFTVNTHLQHENVLADPNRLNQVLMNILSNAVKYTPTGGHIRFEVDELPRNEHYARYRFVVQDDGIGMSEAYQKTLFDPFTREERSGTNKVQGTGLGIAITKNIVDLMGGSINVKSTTGKGTRFEVVLEFPVDAEADTVPEAQVLPEEEEETSPLSGMKFLCAEDNAINAEILEMLLEANGASCTICSNGQEIVDAFASVKPGEYDMILMDVQMPVMDGLEATRRIRSGENPLGRIIPILAMTANAFLEDMQKSREAGMDEHLSKPVDIAALEQTVKRFRVIPPKINSGQARFRRGSTQTM